MLLQCVLHTGKMEKAPDFSGAFILNAGQPLNLPGKRALAEVKDWTSDQHAGCDTSEGALVSITALSGQPSRAIRASVNRLELGAQLCLRR